MSQRALQAATIAALCSGLLHCSAESSPSTIPESTAESGTTGTAGVAAGGAAGTTAAPLAGTGGSETGGTAAGAGGSPGAGGGSGAGISGSAGAVDAAGAGGSGGSSGASSSCAGDGVLCEDFELYPADRAPASGWTASLRGDGKIVVDTAHAFSGKQSLHVTGRMNQDRANISRPIQTESPMLYVRFMMYATSYPASSGVHTRLMRIGTAQAASGNPDSSYSLAAYNGVAIEKVNSIYLRDTGTQFDDPKLLNRWVCWELAIDKSGGAGKVAVKIWVDDDELALSPAGSSSHGMTSPSWDPIPFDLFMLGLDGFQADPQPADFWIDDLAVTTQRVGCASATLP